eukprot:scaffold14198_cov124-Isochrysis_galbana.AAC.6
MTTLGAPPTTRFEREARGSALESCCGVNKCALPHVRRHAPPRWPRDQESVWSEGRVCTDRAMC